MSIFFILTCVSLGIQICLITLSIAAGLYYLAELVEEYTTPAKRIILFMISMTTFFYILFCFFDNLPWRMVLCGFGAQAFHFAIMQNFPFIRFFSLSFIGAVVFLIINHLLAFQYFTTIYYPLMQVLAYFTVCLWLVPFGLFVSLSANDNVLPTVNEFSLHRGDHDVVTNYFARGKKQGLLSLFNYAKDAILPGRTKKSF